MMIHKLMVVKNPLGLHLRQASELVKKLSKFKSEVIVRNGQVSANAKSILDLMTLEAGRGTLLDIIIEGVDADAAINTIYSFFENEIALENQFYSEPA